MAIEVFKATLIVIGLIIAVGLLSKIVEVLKSSNDKKLKVYEIWCMVKDHYYDYEGVNMLGSAEATSFKSACDKFFIKNVLYSSKNLTYKDCRLYKSQIEALNGEEGV